MQIGSVRCLFSPGGGLGRRQGLERQSRIPGDSRLEQAGSGDRNVALGELALTLSRYQPDFDGLILGRALNQLPAFGGRNVELVVVEGDVLRHGRLERIGRGSGGSSGSRWLVCGSLGAT